MKILSIKHLAILDMQLHGKKLILSEFIGANILGIIFGAWIIIHSHYSFKGDSVGVVIIGLACNYLPLSFYGIRFFRGNYSEVSQEDKKEAIKNAAQSLLLAVPFLIVLIAIIQELNYPKQNRL